MGKTAHVILFRRSGKYYTQEYWRIPEDAIGPYDMIHSPDFRRIDGGGPSWSRPRSRGASRICWSEPLTTHGTYR